MLGCWVLVVQVMIDYYGLKVGDKVFDVGCGKGFLFYEMLLLVFGLEIYGIDIFFYVLEYVKEEICDCLLLGNVISLFFFD